MTAPCCSVSQPYGIHDPYCPANVARPVEFFKCDSCDRKRPEDEIAFIPAPNATGSDVSLCLACRGRADEESRENWSSYWDRIEAQIDADEADAQEGER